MSFILLHNFIRSQMQTDPMEEVDEDVVSPGHDADDDFITSFESSDGWDTWRENFAFSMWNN